MIHVVGLGPGNKDYILPIALQTIESAQVIIGAKRNLEALSTEIIEHKEVMNLSVGFDKIAHYIVEHKDATIAVVVSGDAGFYSMLDFVKRHVTSDYINVIPGISSLQYMYSRLGMGYEQAKWISFHGRECDLSHCIRKKKPMGILTDKDKNNQYIAKLLKAKGDSEAVCYVGERLSYEDEKITKLSVDECMTYEADILSVVVIDYE